ncbi:MAG: NAD-dependent protein deacylase [Candidatus Eisenbacteria bacterium]|nr:NAD-dependent protein deacylase [Candidatus Latescibacterota bacterium]MBD3302650.1 NAD-dependent protein deacylase [Candidatus Eisenbacteria bacterium]
MRDRIRGARRWLVLTGAGISAESGVPTFRGAGGLWEGSRPEELASPEGFRADPARVWRWYRWRRELIRGVEPNEGHRAIARLERCVPELCLATQNVDGLHERAGSRNLLELHGNLLRSHCLEGCSAETTEDPEAAVPLCRCGAPLRPSVVWFGETLDEQVLREAFARCERCDVCLIVGTSGVVYPAAALPGIARQAGALLIEVNPEETPLTGLCDRSIRGPAAQQLPAWMRECGWEEEPTPPAGV